MLKKYAVICSVLLAGVAVFSSVQAEEANCSAFGAGEQLPSVVAPSLARGTVVLCNHGYAVQVSPETHGPLWAAEHLWSDDVEAAWKLPRPHVPFAPDPRVMFSASLADYRGSVFDRGHMAPSGDQPNPADQEETFFLSNVVPQTASLNEGIWSRIESRVRRLAEAEGELYVVTGPAYHLKPGEYIGPDQVPVPSSTWKAVYSPSRGRAGVYVCKNAQQHPHCDQVTVQTLTRNTGIDPFPAVSEQVKAQAWRLPAP